jgi:molybdenum-dependent DNA-binding transcriptional regulator ModE
MTSVRLSPQWQIGPADAGLVADPLLALLDAVHDSGGIAQAARELGWSYRHAWGLLRQGEALLGQSLSNWSAAAARSSPTRRAAWCGPRRA